MKIEGFCISILFNHVLLFYQINSPFVLTPCAGLQYMCVFDKTVKPINAFSQYLHNYQTVLLEIYGRKSCCCFFFIPFWSLEIFQCSIFTYNLSSNVCNVHLMLFLLHFFCCLSFVARYDRQLLLLFSKHKTSF